MFRMLKMLVSVPAVMACALGGTVALLKAIGRLSPDGDRGPAEDGNAWPRR